eukprot:Gb_09545 [translate_table: standard]
MNPASQIPEPTGQKIDSLQLPEDQAPNPEGQEFDSGRSASGESPESTGSQDDSPITPPHLIIPLTSDAFTDPSKLLALNRREAARREENLRSRQRICRICGAKIGVRCEALDLSAAACYASCPCLSKIRREFREMLYCESIKKNEIRSKARYDVVNDQGNVIGSNSKFDVQVDECEVKSNLDDQMLKLG